MNNNILIAVIGVLVGGSALYVGYTYKRPITNSRIFDGSLSNKLSSRELLDDIGVSRHSGGTHRKSNHKSNHKSHRKKIK